MRLLTGACRYKSVESILKNSLDQAPPVVATARIHAAARQHPRRRSTSNKERHMLQEPMMEKLTAMRLSAWWMR